MRPWYPEVKINSFLCYSVEKKIRKIKYFPSQLLCFYLFISEYTYGILVIAVTCKNVSINISEMRLIEAVVLEIVFLRFG